MPSLVLNPSDGGTGMFLFLECVILPMSAAYHWLA
jgi:hypothetical protein